MAHLLVLSLLFSIASSSHNVTIDDQLGDAATGLFVSYSPSTGAWQQGATCSGCLLQPDLGQALDGTWHDSTYGGQAPGPYSFTLLFDGDAIYVYCILADGVPFATTATSLQFTLDNQPGAQFSWDPDNSVEQYTYNALVYGNTNIRSTATGPSGLHNLTVQSLAAILFDYAVYTVPDPVEPPDTSAPPPPISVKPSPPATSSSPISSPTSIGLSPSPSAPVPSIPSPSGPPTSGAGHSSTLPSSSAPSSSPAPSSPTPSSGPATSPGTIAQGSSTSPNATFPPASSVAAASNTSVTSNAAQRDVLGPAVGGAVGGVVLIVAALLLVVCLRRRPQTSKTHLGLDLGGEIPPTDAPLSSAEPLMASREIALSSTNVSMPASGAALSSPSTDGLMSSRAPSLPSGDASSPLVSQRAARQAGSLFKQNDESSTAESLQSPHEEQSDVSTAASPFSRSQPTWTTTGLETEVTVLRQQLALLTRNQSWEDEDPPEYHAAQHDRPFRPRADTSY